MENLLFLLEGFVLLLLLNSRTHSIHCPNRGLHWCLHIKIEKQDLYPLCRSDFKKRWHIIPTGWMIQAEYIHVCFVLFLHFKRISISHRLIKLATTAVSIMFIRFSIFLSRLSQGRGFVIQSSIFNETGWCLFCPPVHLSLEAVKLLIFQLEKLAWGKLPMGQSLVDGSGVSNPVTKKRGGLWLLGSVKQTKVQTNKSAAWKRNHSEPYTVAGLWQCGH